jgi:hypothetical protein
MGPLSLRWSQYALLLKKPFIYGAISHVERTRILNAFKHNPQVTPASIRSSTPAGVNVAAHLSNAVTGHELIPSHHACKAWNHLEPMQRCFDGVTADLHAISIRTSAYRASNRPDAWRGTVAFEILSGEVCDGVDYRR